MSETAALGTEGEEPKPMIHEQEKSDPPIVATKLANKSGRNRGESVERRGGARGNTDWSNARRTQSRINLSWQLDHVRQAARQRKKEKFTALFQLINIDLLEMSFFWLKKRGGWR
jgi:RNA-directed DNA polymerase